MFWFLVGVAILVWIFLSARSGGGSERERRDRTVDWQGLLDRTDVLILDSETTGFRNSSEIIELAVMDTTGAVRLDRLIMPKGRIPSAASDVHGITRADLHKADAPAWPSVHAEACELLQAADTVLIYNADFDTRLLRQTAERHGLTMPAFKARCVMLDYASYRRVPTSKPGWRWFKLTDAARHHGVPVDNAHRAADDARLTLELMRAVVAERKQGAA